MGPNKTIIMDLSFVKPSSKDECGDEEEKEIVELLKSSKFYKQLQAERVSEGAFIIDDVLSEEECSFICEKLDKCDSMSFWNPEGRKTKILQFRNVDTIEINSQNVADVLWTRIKDSGISTDTFISDSVTSDVYETGCDGTWTAQGLNNHLLFAKYPSGGSFAPHTDGNVILTLNIRSFFSVILYLNSIPSGGETRFFHQDAVNNLTLVGRPDNEIWSCDDSFTLFEVSPKAGRLLLFSQHLAHSGQPVAPPYNKYIIRSDVMFKRSPPICDSDNDREAFDLYRKAQDFAEKGEVDKSISLFKKAFRISPALKVLLGQG